MCADRLQRIRQERCAFSAKIGSPSHCVDPIFWHIGGKIAANIRADVLWRNRCGEQSQIWNVAAPLPVALRIAADEQRRIAAPYLQISLPNEPQARNGHRQNQITPMTSGSITIQRFRKSKFRQHILLNQHCADPAADTVCQHIQHRRKPVRQKHLPEFDQHRNADSNKMTKIKLFHGTTAPEMQSLPKVKTICSTKIRYQILGIDEDKKWNRAQISKNASSPRHPKSNETRWSATSQKQFEQTQHRITRGCGWNSMPEYDIDQIVR